MIFVAGVNNIFMTHRRRILASWSWFQAGEQRPDIWRDKPSLSSPSFLWLQFLSAEKLINYPEQILHSVTGGSYQFKKTNAVQCFEEKRKNEKKEKADEAKLDIYVSSCDVDVQLHRCSSSASLLCISSVCNKVKRCRKRCIQVLSYWSASSTSFHWFNLIDFFYLFEFYLNESKCFWKRICASQPVYCIGWRYW